MDTAFKKDIYEHLAPVWSGSFSRDFTAETIVPDAMPDVASVVDADGVITLRSKETEAGAVTLAASVSVWVMYVPEGGGPLQSLNMTLPAELRADAPGADTEPRATAHRPQFLFLPMINRLPSIVRTRGGICSCVVDLPGIQPGGLLVQPQIGGVSAGMYAPLLRGQPDRAARFGPMGAVVEAASVQIRGEFGEEPRQLLRQDGRLGLVAKGGEPGRVGGVCAVA